MRRIGVGDVRLSAQAKANVLDALNNNRLSYGPYSRRFESEFADLHNRNFACLVNSGTDALRVGLATLKEQRGWKDGDEVLVPALTFVASLNVIIQNGLKPVLVDVDPDYYEMMPADRYYLGDRTVGVMPVSLFGQPIDPAVTSFAKSQGWGVIEDSCETMFVGYSAADVTCYSTYACHVISTGVGGLALTDDPELAMLIRSYANHGRSGIYTSIDQSLGQREVMDARFQFERLGYSSRLTELEAAIGCAELESWQSNILARRHNASQLRRELEGLPLRFPAERVTGKHAFMMWPFLCEDEETRDRLVLHLEAHGVETRPMLPLTSQPYVRQLLGADVEDRYPVAKRINRTGAYVGCHQHLDDGDIEYIGQTFRAFFA